MFGINKKYRKVHRAHKTVNHKLKTLNSPLGVLGCFLAFCAVCTVNSALALEFQAGGKKDSYIDVTVNNIELSSPSGDLSTINREPSTITTDLTFDLRHVSLKGNAELVVTPMFVDNSGNEAELGSFTIVGRNRFYWLERNGKDKDIETLIKGWGKERGSVVNSEQRLVNRDQRLENRDQRILNTSFSIPYQPWLNEARLVLKTEDIGCANCGKGENDYPLAATEYVELTYAPAQFIYVTPVAEAVKTREIAARAYIDFVVNRTEINPTYRRNPEELAKIRATIDSIRNDKDITVTKLHISGTASPEGSYQNNVRLAKGRTESLKDYVQGLYKFPAGFITTSFEPVDWTGLADYLRKVLGIGDKGSENLPHAQEILNIVNGDLAPEQRNNKIKSTYPKEYAWLLANVYPALRHSDYRIEFEIKTYTEVSEIIEVMETQPNKLSLAELFVAANSQPEGSELYNRAFELAVTMFPEDETANLNAAIAALKRNDFVTANRYLAKAGDTAEAKYARAVSAFLQEDYDTAKEMLLGLTLSQNAQVAEQAAAMLRNMREVDSSNGFRWREL